MNLPQRLLPRHLPLPAPRHVRTHVFQRPRQSYEQRRNGEDKQRGRHEPGERHQDPDEDQNALHLLPSPRRPVGTAAWAIRLTSHRTEPDRFGEVTPRLPDLPLVVA